MLFGAHDRYTRGNQGLGPIASQDVASAPKAILVGRGAPVDKVWRVLAAVDGSLASEHALSLMGACLSLRAAEITVMHVTERPGFTSVWVGSGSRFQQGRLIPMEMRARRR
jgi:hypothetical protein